ncbi:NUDIX domain-containing protein [Micromonospora sp. NBRC 101691]|uniref:NUDIX domain-containing protein n=1 Tax=Micromonospora sp. NBRC 101691 TaxID=3032198 RepID=UPI0024A4283A|nr:NUDIX domain-containing protein [Micromonospora sp. NBRC 101691]GLY24828.1 hypothetical protein Misp04_45600 [Micromonospora sp. NBRC 101691]
MTVDYTHPSVLAGIAAGAVWADPEMDPTRIDWTARRALAAIPFPLVDGRPVNPYAPTGIRYGRNELGHWGEALAADAVVVATVNGLRRILMVERDDNHGWALPGGHVDPGEDPRHAAFRELAEETCLRLDPASTPHTRFPARYVPDPRASDEAWMVTVPVLIDLGTVPCLPWVDGADDARQVTWAHAESYQRLTDYLRTFWGGGIFAAHRDLLADILDHGQERP